MNYIYLKEKHLNYLVDIIYKYQTQYEFNKISQLDKPTIDKFILDIFSEFCEKTSDIEDINIEEVTLSTLETLCRIQTYVHELSERFASFSKVDIKHFITDSSRNRDSISKLKLVMKAQALSQGYTETEQQVTLKNLENLSRII